MAGKDTVLARCRLQFQVPAFAPLCEQAQSLRTRLRQFQLCSYGSDGCQNREDKYTPQTAYHNAAGGNCHAVAQYHRNYCMEQGC
jgi:hypothetical protein